MARRSANRRLENRRIDDRRKPLAADVSARRDEYLSPTEVADLLLVKPVTVRLWATKGLLRSVTTPGGHRRFSARDVEALVARHQTGKSGGRETPSRVLIIDDDRQFSRYLAKVIAAQKTGAVVEVANDGFTAGIKCESIRPDIVTLDLHMPDMDGYEVCSMLRTMFGKAKPRIVALTAYATPRNVERILAAGANSCVAKKVSAKVLLREMGLDRAVKA
jgi:excisionase family DNA binding protein